MNLKTRVVDHVCAGSRRGLPNGSSGRPPRCLGRNVVEGRLYGRQWVGRRFGGRESSGRYRRRRHRRPRGIEGGDGGEGGAASSLF